MKPANNGTAKPEPGTYWAEDATVSFPTWSRVLADEALAPGIKSRRKFALMGFLAFCKGERKPTSITLVKAYLARLVGQGKFIAGVSDGDLDDHSVS